MSDNSFLKVKGWHLLAHPLFLDQIEYLIQRVAQLRDKEPRNYSNKNATKRLAAINDLIWDFIPSDPSNPKYRQGNTLGKEYRHWHKATFFQQYRIFFRYHSGRKIIIYGWVNDMKTKGAYNSKTDAYRVFERMLRDKNPPTNWEDLLKESELEESRFKKIATDNFLNE